MGSQDVREQLPRAPADVHETTEAREVVGVQHRRGHYACECGHCLVVDGGLLGVGGGIVEERHSVNPLGGWFAGPYAAAEGCPTQPAAPAAKTPRAESARKSRRSETAWVFVAVASSALRIGRAARWSAMPSF